MATVTRIEKNTTQVVDIMQCEDCHTRFGTFGGFPDYCPECGVEFEHVQEFKMAERKKRVNESRKPIQREA